VRAAVVSSKTLRKYGRWDPEFYMGNRTSGMFKDRMVRIKKRLDREKVRLKKARAEEKEHCRKARRMIETGEVVPFKGGGR